MAYTTESEVRAATGFTDTVKFTSAYITGKISAADSVINGKIRDVYSLPLSETPSIIAEISLQITKALLYAREYGEEAQGTDKDSQSILDYYMGLLDQIQSQELKLYDTSNDELARSTLKSLSYKPDNDSSADGERDEARITMDMKF